MRRVRRQPGLGPGQQTQADEGRQADRHRPEAARGARHVVLDIAQPIGTAARQQQRRLHPGRDRGREAHLPPNAAPPSARASMRGPSTMQHRGEVDPEHHHHGARGATGRGRGAPGTSAATGHSRPVPATEATAAARQTDGRQDAKRQQQQAGEHRDGPLAPVEGGGEAQPRRLPCPTAGPARMTAPAAPAARTASPADPTAQ